MTTSGVGVKLTWPSDFNKWPEKGKAYDALKKQVQEDIRQLIMNGVAENSSDVEEMPYAIQMSDPGSQRKIVIQFAFEDDEDDSKYDRETCIELSKKLEAEIKKMKSQVKPALQNWKNCKMFSEPAPAELNAVIEQQKVTITALEEKVDAVSEELSQKTNELEILQTNMDNLDNESIRSQLAHTSEGGQHIARNINITQFSGAGSVVKLPDIFGKQSNLRSASIFNGTVPGNSLKTTDLLSQLLHSKYEVLRSKRSLQLLSVRHQLQQDQMKQLRYTISRMQSEFMDMKATSLVSKAVMSNVAESYDTLSMMGAMATRGSVVGDMIRQASTRSGLFPSSPLMLQNAKSGGSDANYLTDDDIQFAADALQDIQLNLDPDDPESTKSRRSSTRSTGSSSGVKPELIRKMSSMIGAPSRHTQSISREAAKADQRKRRRARSVSGDNHSRHRSYTAHFAPPKASDAYPLKRKDKNLSKQILKNNKEAKQFGNSAGEYLTRKSLAGKQLMRSKAGNALANDMIASMVSASGIETDDDELDQKEKTKGADRAPKGVDFADKNRLWRDYDKEWIRRWDKDDVASWVKKIYDGRMRKYAKEFKRKKINGKMLLDIGNQDLLGMGMTRKEANQILEFTNSIAVIIDGSDDGFGDFFDDLVCCFICDLVWSHWNH